MATIFVVTYNRDYQESAAAFNTREAAVADIANSFDCESEPDTESFWREVFDTYQASSWKGFQFLTLDTETLAMADAEGTR